MSALQSRAYAPGDRVAWADHEASVPLDEQHWIPQQVRDQLVRLTAAERMHQAAEFLRVPLPHRRLGDVLATVGCADDDLVSAARALLGLPALVPTP